MIIFPKFLSLNSRRKDVYFFCSLHRCSPGSSYIFQPDKMWPNPKHCCLFNFKMFIHVFKFSHGNLLQLQNPPRSVSSSTSCLLHILILRFSTFGSCAFNCFALKFLNLPKISILLFTSLLKTHHIDQPLLAQLSIKVFFAKYPLMPRDKAYTVLQKKYIL